jgi:hypothetical protein
VTSCPSGCDLGNEKIGVGGKEEEMGNVLQIYSCRKRCLGYCQSGRTVRPE